MSSRVRRTLGCRRSGPVDLYTLRWLSFSCTSYCLKLNVSSVLPTYLGSCGMFFSSSWVNTTEVCVESVGDVIVSGDNLASRCFEWSYIISNYSSLINVGVEALRVSFALSCNIDFLVAFGLLHCTFNQPSRSEVFSAGFISVVPLSFIINTVGSLMSL